MSEYNKSKGITSFSLVEMKGSLCVLAKAQEVWIPGKLVQAPWHETNLVAIISYI